MVLGKSSLNAITVLNTTTKWILGGFWTVSCVRGRLHPARFSSRPGWILCLPAGHLVLYYPISAGFHWLWNKLLFWLDNYGGPLRSYSVSLTGLPSSLLGDPLCSFLPPGKLEPQIIIINPPNVAPPLSLSAWTYDRWLISLPIASKRRDFCILIIEV